MGDKSGTEIGSDWMGGDAGTVPFSAGTVPFPTGAVGADGIGAPFASAGTGTATGMAPFSAGCAAALGACAGAPLRAVPLGAVCGAVFSLGGGDWTGTVTTTTLGGDDGGAAGGAADCAALFESWSAPSAANAPSICQPTRSSSRCATSLFA